MFRAQKSINPRSAVPHSERAHLRLLRHLPRSSDRALREPAVQRPGRRGRQSGPAAQFHFTSAGCNARPPYLLHRLLYTVPTAHGACANRSRGVASSCPPRGYTLLILPRVQGADDVPACRLGARPQAPCTLSCVLAATRGVARKAPFRTNTRAVWDDATTPVSVRMRPVRYCPSRRIACDACTALQRTTHPASTVCDCP
ncbi:hypothetical protein B0H16DRAFT_1729082 [Mycena metata]|uniref:Uncharacterized protein n=1 Tax=Mycena metata TaxID=1033252 RepID=A0AAD7ID42_9AGAR|nr:hypothetical protein B0H16DRAFT_1729082 [Mycena metata]